MQFEVEGLVFANDGDEVEVTVTVNPGDVVWFERTGPRKVVLRVVAGEVAGTRYRVEQGGPGVMRFVALQ
ncbi:MAG: hypothetical protein C0501_06825 [Isosphaera sp.]|nr:hypothetical protein [Isosphaera sp.]